MKFDLSFLNNKKVVLLFTPGLDTFLTRWVLNNNNITNYNRVYFDINGMYSKQEIYILKELYMNSFDIKKLPLGILENYRNAHVKNRNMIFTTYAQGIYDADIVLISGVKDDRVSDNNKEFFDKLSDVVSLSSEKNIKISSLFWDYEKSELIKKYINNNDPMTLLKNTFSCYYPEGTISRQTIPVFEKIETKFILKDKLKLFSGCRKCKACFRKYCALTAANIYVPFLNLNLLQEYSIENCSNEYPNRQKTIDNYLNFNSWIKNITY